MKKNKSIIAIIPARGGSKGIKLKNLRKLNGKSLVDLVGEIVSQLDFVDRAVISTDHPEIARVAKLSGLDVPSMRPNNLSGDLISDVEVLTHVLLEVEKLDNKKYDIIVMLQPTSPFRKAEHVLSTVNKLVDGDYDSVITVSETDSKSHPLKQLVLSGDKVKYYDNRGKKIIARQQLTPVYHRNGAAYSMTRECLLVQKAIIGKNSSAVIIDDELVNIDNKWDLEYAKYLINNGLVI